MKKIFIILLVLTFWKTIPAQVNLDWAQVYHSAGIYEWGRDVCVAKSGNVYALGTIVGANSSDCIIFKFSNSGDLIWTKTYNSSFNMDDNAISMALDNRENVYIVGDTYSIETASDLLTIKYDSSGTMNWLRIYIDTLFFGTDTILYGDDYVKKVLIDSLSNVYVTGTWGVIKYDSFGNLLWKVRDNISIYDMSVDKNSEVYITGFIDNGSQTLRDCSTIKYNSSGQKMWESDYIRPDHDGGFSVTTDDSGNVFVTGKTDDKTSSNYSNYLTIKYDQFGNQKWVANYGNGEENVGKKIQVDAAGNVYVTGDALQGYPWNNDSFGTIKYNSNGQLIWLRLYVGNEATDLKLDKFDNVYVTGYGHDFVTLKYSPSGNLIWNALYNGGSNVNDEAYSMALDEQGNVFVTGSAVFPSELYNVTTVKYSQILTGIQTQNLLSAFTLSQNYPNPFNPVTNLEFGIAELGFVSLKIYDALGKEVTTLVNENKSPGSYSVQFDGSNFPSGVYYYKLETGDFSEVRKMILLK